MSATSIFWERICKWRHNWRDARSSPPPSRPVADGDPATTSAPDNDGGVEHPASPTREVIPFPVADARQTTPAAPVQSTWTLVLSDTDNDFEPVRHHLWLIGLCDRRGCWNPDIPPFRVIHTGDWLNKWSPDPHVLDSFKRLMDTAPAGVEMSLLVGNHELAILRMAEMGLQTPLTAEDLAFIRACDVLHRLGEILFLHGYPSPLLLDLLTQFQQEGTPPDRINTRLHAAFFEGEHALFREEAGLELTGYLRKPKTFYARPGGNGVTIGQQIAAQLRELGITTVIHGHKPVAVTQTDDELERYLPGVRVINNDNGVRTTGLGALLIDPHGAITFINPDSLSAAGGRRHYRKQLRKLLKTRQRGKARNHGSAPRAVAA
ncbi:MAG: hypothetical protein HQM02_11620 [Magnetococcales bacterium]|nr:hypothetical protein [Magnetococcales bacterium]